MDLSGTWCRRRSEPAEALVGKVEHDHPVEAACHHGAYTELLVDLAFLRKGRRLDLGERGVLLPSDRPLGARRRARDRGRTRPAEGLPFLEGAKKVAETNLPARGRPETTRLRSPTSTRRRSTPGWDTSPRAAACRRNILAHPGNGTLLLRLRGEITHEIALTACIRISFQSARDPNAEESGTPSPPTSGNAGGSARAARVRMKRLRAVAGCHGQGRADEGDEADDE